MDENEFHNFESMYETEMDIARELETDFEEGIAATSIIKNPVNPTISSIKRNLFSLENVENVENVENSWIAASDNNLQKTSVSNNNLPSQPLKMKTNMKHKTEESLNDYLNEIQVNLPKHKKQKIMNDEDAKIIAKILIYRREAERSNPESHIHFNKKLKASSWGKNSIHRHIPPGDFLSITTLEGKRFYLDIITEQKFDLIVNEFATSESNAHLLEEPYNLLKVKAENELCRMKQNEENVFLKEAQVHPIYDEESNKEILWVEKYRPNHYLDLLSSEGTNKTVLRWLKLWDKIVFGRNFLATKNKDKKPNVYNKSAPDVIEKLDEMGIPEQKVILLCGPPGLGKTTLAHVIARHAGYNVLEMNASDDRSTELFKKNIENATSMKSVLGNEKPNCLIIDEIDGAPTASIALLVNLLQGNKVKEQKRGKKNVKILKRPVICICNDLYTTSLRALRHMSLIVRFIPTQSNRLIDRLNTISIKQNLKADLAVLRALCNKTENDIRSCLSVLQFMKSSSGELHFSDLEGVAVGQKDYQRSLFTGWQEIFNIPAHKKKGIKNLHLKEADVPIQDARKSDGSSSESRSSRLLKVIAAIGEYDKLTLGWFENYPKTKFKHTYLDSAVQGLEWATTSDILQQEINRSQSWILMKYLPYAFVVYHLLFATHQRPKLLFPMQFSDHIAKLAKCRGEICSMTSEMLPYTKFFSGSSNLVFDIIPYLLVIIQPQLRPVNIHLYSQREKDIFRLLVDSMISYNLTYKQERSVDGQYSFNICPNIEDVAYYIDVVRGKPLSYSCRQLVAREIDMEKVRRADNYFSGRSKETSNERTPVGVKKLTNKPAVPLETTIKMTDKRVLKESQVPRDFFGRKMSVSSKEMTLKTQKRVLVSDIWFKFKEGYSNAVRRPIKLKNLLS